MVAGNWCSMVGSMFGDGSRAEPDGAAKVCKARQNQTVQPKNIYGKNSYSASAL